MIIGANKIIKCQRKESAKVLKCHECKKEIKPGDFYTRYGIKARTYHERVHASKGHCWYVHCEKCAPATEEQVTVFGQKANASLSN